MLRRQKSDVLADLPPKIIQDYCCELSPLQKMLYEDFAKSRAKKSIESGVQEILMESMEAFFELKDGLHIVLSNVCIIKLASTTRFGTFFKDLMQTAQSFQRFTLLSITHMLKDFLSFLINTRYF